MKLKPCPFYRKMYWVSCKACGISQQNTNVSGYRYQSKAIDRWNRREPMDKIVEQLEIKKILAEGSDSRIRNKAFKEAIEIVKSGGAV